MPQNNELFFALQWCGPHGNECSIRARVVERKVSIERSQCASATHAQEQTRCCFCATAKHSTRPATHVGNGVRRWRQRRASRHAQEVSEISDGWSLAGNYLKPRVTWSCSCGRASVRSDRVQTFCVHWCYSIPSSWCFALAHRNTRLATCFDLYCLNSTELHMYTSLGFTFMNFSVFKIFLEQSSKKQVRLHEVPSIVCLRTPTNHFPDFSRHCKVFIHRCIFDLDIIIDQATTFLVYTHTFSLVFQLARVWLVLRNFLTCRVRWNIHEYLIVFLFPSILVIPYVRRKFFTSIDSYYSV